MHDIKSWQITRIIESIDETLLTHSEDSNGFARYNLLISLTHLSVHAFSLSLSLSLSSLSLLSLSFALIQFHTCQLLES